MGEIKIDYYGFLRIVMGFLVAILIFLLSINVAQATDAPAASSSAECNAGRSATEVEDAMKQLQKSITEMRTNIAKIQVEISQEKTEKQHIIKKICTLKDTVDQLSSQLRLLVSEEKEFQSHMSTLYAADCNRFQIDIKQSQGLLQDMKQQCQITRERESEQKKQFAQQLKSLEITELKIKDEVSFYADASEKKLKLCSQSVVDKVQRESSAVMRKIEKNEMNLDMKVQRYKKDLEKIAEEKIRSIKELQGDNARINQLGESIRYLMLSQSFLCAVPVTYILCVLMSKLGSIIFKREMHADQKTVIFAPKQILKTIGSATGIAAMYCSLSFLLYRVSRCIVLQETLFLSIF
jgi:hypothetical protein